MSALQSNNVVSPIQNIRYLISAVDWREIEDSSIQLFQLEYQIRIAKHEKKDMSCARH